MTRDDWEQHWLEYGGTAEQNPAQSYRREMILSLLNLQGTGQGARIIPMSDSDHYRHFKVFLNPSLLERVDYDPLESFDPQLSIQENAWHSEAAGQSDFGFFMDGHYHSVIVLTREGCYLILTAPGGPMSAFDKHIGHRKHWRQQEIESLLRKASYTPEIVTGAGFPFFNLYRGLVILRGRRLISDVSSSANQNASLAARAGMAIFQRLLRRKTNSSRWGWQMVARARV